MSFRVSKCVYLSLECKKKKLTQKDVPRELDTLSMNISRSLREVYARITCDKRIKGVNISHMAVSKITDAEER